jgi:hypothetical protein
MRLARENGRRVFIDVVIKTAEKRGFFSWDRPDASTVVRWTG